MGMLLPVELTQDELLARGRELASVKDEHTQAQADLEAATEGWKDSKKAMQERIEDHESEMRRIARAIRSGREDRDVDVREEPDFETGIMRTVRADTGDLVQSRGLTEAERQRSLFAAPERAAAAEAAGQVRA